MVPRSESSRINYPTASLSTSFDTSSRPHNHDSQISLSSPTDIRILQLKNCICGSPIYHYDRPEYATFLRTSTSFIDPSEQQCPEAVNDKNPRSNLDLALDSIVDHSQSFKVATVAERQVLLSTKAVSYNSCERFGIQHNSNTEPHNGSLLPHISDHLALSRKMASSQPNLKNGKKMAQRDSAAAIDAESPLLNMPSATSPHSMIDLPSPISPTLPPLPADAMDIPSPLQALGANDSHMNFTSNDKRTRVQKTANEGILPKASVNRSDVHSQKSRTRSLIVTLSIPRRKRKKLDTEDGEIDDTLLSLASGKAAQKRRDIRFSRSPSPHSIAVKTTSHVLRKGSTSPTRKASEHREQSKGAPRNKNASNVQKSNSSGKASKVKGDSERLADVRDSSHRQRHAEQADPYARKNAARHFSPSPPPPLVERPDSLAGIKRPDNSDDYRHFNQKLQTLATSLKHAGDHGLKAETVSWLPHAQHIEAVLLYAYSFWCEDKINPAGSQWTSLVQLLRFVVEHLERRGEHVLAGLCIRLQALTFASIVQNRSRAVRNKASKLNADLVNTNTSSTVDVSNITSLIADHLKQNVEDSDKVARYWLRSEGRLTAEKLRRQFPRVWQHCISSNPSKSDDADPSSDVGRRFLPPFHWPIHPYTSIPEFVSFARSVLEEWAERRGLSDYRFASGLSL